ncbi:MAG: flgK [Deltaproteobacteria bacterium]|jgi:flagellar hook-associated protein 1 FlgK|nr:flgK [Deltaproteobacteria bacterium]
MAGIRSIFDIARGALTASQLSLQTVSHNIANVNTKGYARQEAALEEAMPLPGPVGYLGNGVKVSQIVRYVDKFIEATIAQKNTDLEFQKTSEKYLQQMEGVLNEDNAKLSANVTAFFNAWQELSTDPASITPRTALLTAGENLARSIRTVYQDLRGLQQEIDHTVAQEIENVNRITTTIAELNQRIFDGGMVGDANDYLNQRQELLNELSGKLDVVAFEDEFGRLTVLTGKGKTLVDAFNHWDLKAYDTEGEGFYRICWEDSQGNLADITADVDQGTLGALLTERDVNAEDFVAQINALAKTITEEVNRIHEGGYNLNFTTGISFFRPLTQNYAAQMDVSDDIKDDVMNIAATSSPDRPTDNDIALALAALGTADLAFDVNGNVVNTTASEFVASMLSRVGALTRNATDLVEYQQNTMDLLSKQREAVSGVSLDEEMTNLIKFQRAYEAAARLITVADEMLQTIIEASK